MKSLKKLWPELRPHRWQIAVVASLGLVIAATSGFLPYVIQILIDALDTEKSKNPELYTRLPFFNTQERIVFMLPFLLVGVYALNGVARYFHLYLMRLVGERVTLNIRKLLLEQYLRLNLTFHNSYASGSGGLISRTLNDVNVLQNGISIIANVMREPLVATALLFYLFYTSWKLTLFLITVLPIFILTLKQTAKSLRKYGNSNQEELEGLTSTLKESLDGIRVIQSFNLENEMRGKFDHKANAYLGTRSKIISREELSSPVNDFIGSLFFAVLCLYVGQEILGGRLTVGQFFGYIAALGLFQKPVKALQDSFVKIQQTIVVVNRIYSILDNRNYVKQPVKTTPFPTHWQSIVYENVSFRYNQEDVLRGINLTIHRGEVVALVGESGSGKSTLVNLLERFFDPTSGRILIGGVPIQDIALEELRANIALVTQDVFLFRDSIHNNIHAGDFHKNPALVTQAAQAANAHDFIQRFPDGYENNVGERGNLLSGGERQRVSIARAILKDAPLLILDEATSALDSASEVEVQKGLDRLMQGRTALVIAHRLSTVSKADRILVMKQGQIIEQGKHQELISAQGEYFRFHSLQAH